MSCKAVLRYLRHLVTGAGVVALVGALFAALVAVPWRLGSWAWQLGGHEGNGSNDDAVTSWFIGAGIVAAFFVLPALGRAVRLSREDDR